MPCWELLCCRHPAFGKACCLVVVVGVVLSFVVVVALAVRTNPTLLCCCVFLLFFCLLRPVVVGAGFVPAPALRCWLLLCIDLVLLLLVSR
jgi:hypothetical protein